MKFGFRTPSLSKSLKARTTGKAKRAFKKAVIPYYGEKGTGMIKDPKKSIYNSVYNKTTRGVSDLTKKHNNKQKNNFSDVYMRNVNIVNECVEIMNNTLDPKIYFSRRDLYKEKFQWLADNENKIEFEGESPSLSLKKVYASETSDINEFIDRYYNHTIEKIDTLKTQKAKFNNVHKFKDTLILYVCSMNEDNVIYFQRLSKSLEKKYK